MLFKCGFRCNIGMLELYKVKLISYYVIGVIGRSFFVMNQQIIFFKIFVLGSRLFFLP